MFVYRYKPQKLSSSKIEDDHLPERCIIDLFEAVELLHHRQQLQNLFSTARMIEDCGLYNFVRKNTTVYHCRA